MALDLRLTSERFSAAGLAVGHNMLMEAVLAGWPTARHPRQAPTRVERRFPDTKGFGRRLKN